MNPERLKQVADLVAAGTPKTEIARQLGVSRKTVYQYIARLQEGMAEELAEKPAVVAQVVQNHIDVIEQLKDANQVAWELLNNFKEEKPYVALSALERIQEQLTLQAKLIGLISSGTQINILQIENFSREVYEVIQEVCCPACKDAILTGLRARRARYQPAGGPGPAD
ncbi:MAG: helix-turn-helix domain-containing protein [Bacillota bacterium]